MNLALVDGALGASSAVGRCARLDPGDGRCCVSIMGEDAGYSWDELSADEQDDLEERARLLVEAAYRSTASPHARIEDITREVMDRALASYESARLSNVCREGAIELFENAVREQLP